MGDRSEVLSGHHILSGSLTCGTGEVGAHMGFQFFTAVESRDGQGLSAHLVPSLFPGQGQARCSLASSVNDNTRYRQPGQKAAFSQASSLNMPLEEDRQTG
ncbi:hypothetical protein KIL84_008973 [Mauremys mutica]|uniref:Uncharacterized protein n=1 Tax=Mauremys mutica TaxID=74926 RepID=A0A9D3XI52_9SAUR|nr:hypothetical protein KIL84_008973 [Mauremys mutica]